MQQPTAAEPHKTETCPNCGAEITFKEKDDYVELFNCPNCGIINLKKEQLKSLLLKDEPLKNCDLCDFYLTLDCGLLKARNLTPKEAVEAYEIRNWVICTDFKLGKKQKLTPDFLDHINEIENPKLAGKPIIVDAVISSTSLAYLIPRKIDALVISKNGKGNEELEVTHLEKEISIDDPININLSRINATNKQKLLKVLLNTKNHVNEREFRTIYIVRVRPPVFTLEKKGERLIDEKGYEYKPFDIYVVSDNSLKFTPSSVVQFEGIILPNPKTQKTTLLAYKAVLPDDVKTFNVTKLKKLKKKFLNKTIKERIEWIISQFEIYSQLIGRRNLIFSTFLAYFSPLYIKFNGDTQRGFANNLHIGDTTCGKSQCQRKVNGLLNAGMLITAETASTVGLLGTATQMAGKEWFVDWGFLVLQDQKLLAIDGAQKLSSANWAALAETERTGIVNIAKAAKNTAYARTRQIKIANPVDLEEKKYSTKSLANFLYPIQSLSTILDKTSIARIDLIVFADQRDVKPEEINQHHKTEYDMDIHLLSESLKWNWSNSTKVEFTEDSENYLLKKATELYNKFFCEMIPVVSIDVKWKLARLSVSLAYLTLSTEDFETIIVKEEHVREIVEFIDSEYSKAGLNSLATEMELDILEIDNVKEIYDLIVAATKAKLDYQEITKIFKFIVIQGQFTRDNIKTKFDLSENNQLRPLLSILDNEKLVKRGRGYYPTPKLIQAYKIIDSPEFIKFIKINNLKKEPPEKLDDY